ncbi:MAG: GatB/YqeY domain-containing protein, partial [Gammaproteobacteria bacterium]|nr:GatB/YqeY domain-containing protein [Gammaproteobacteria bacterium]
MNKKDELQQALKDAMKAGNDRKKRVVRMAISSIRNAEIDRQKDLEEPEVLAILQKEIKSRRETIEGAEQSGRDDLIEEALAEIEILESFLPKPLSEAELEALVDETIKEVGA